MRWHDRRLDIGQERDVRHEGAFHVAKESTMHSQTSRSQRFAIPSWGLVAFTLLGASLTGCPVWGDGGSDPCRSGRCTSVCDTTADCNTGELCDGGACVPQTMCRTHGDCPVGAFCDATTNECTPSSECSTDAACTGGFWCDFRTTCVPHTPGDCRSNTDCSTGSLCIEDRCVVTDTTCQLDRECPAGQACVNNECTAPCRDDGQCLAGDRCISSFCRPSTTCTTSAGCDSGERCVTGRCLPDCATALTCETGSTCAPDQFCRPDWERTPFCTMDSDCNDGRVCRVGVCRTPCPVAPMTCMNIDAQFTGCAQEGADMLCVAPTETPACRVNADCPTGRDCVNGQCRARN